MKLRPHSCEARSQFFLATSIQRPQQHKDFARSKYPHLDVASPKPSLSSSPQDVAKH